MAQNNKLGIGCGTWERILQTYHRGPDGRRPKAETRDFYEAMVERGVFERDNNYVYRLTKRGESMAEWCLAILPQHQVRIRWKMIPR